MALALPIAGCPLAEPCPQDTDPPAATPYDLPHITITCLLCAVALAVLAIVLFFALRHRHGLWQRKSAFFVLLLSALSLLVAQRAWAAYLPFAFVHLAETWQWEQHFGAAYDNSIFPMVSNFRGLMVLDVLAVVFITLVLLYRAARVGIARLRSTRTNATLTTAPKHT